MTTQITVLSDNTAADQCPLKDGGLLESGGQPAGQDLLTEHGLAYWIEAAGRRVLFDSGQGLVLGHNAESLRLAWESLDAIALSHGHYDHTGGLELVLSESGQTPLYAHPAFLEPKYARTCSGAVREIGVPRAVRERLQQHQPEWLQTLQPATILPHFTITGEIPRVTDFEDNGGAFYLDAACKSPDPLADDQALFFQTSLGTVVLLGCAHAGVINTLLYVRQLSGDRPIHTVLGGMHLLHASERRMEETIRQLRALNVQRLLPGHCTGEHAIEALLSAFPARCQRLSVGMQLTFD